MKKVEKEAAKGAAKQKKVGKLAGGAVGFIAVAPALFSSLGWAAVLLSGLGAIALIILIVKEVRKK